MLNQLKKCNNKHDLAILLKIDITHLNYVLFSKELSNKYQKYEIPKKSGGTREILAPCDELKYLQQRLSDILYQCYEEIQLERLSGKIISNKGFSSYGFQKKLSVDGQVYNLTIFDNAKKHVNKRHVLNVDLKDFFQGITFPRIVGFFIKNNHFKLEKEVAVLIAQIATFRNSSNDIGYLPQGSPCSPIISNLIASILDRKILYLAKKYKLNYSRYVDDITLSTNLREFPKEIAFFDNNQCIVGNQLNKVIIKSNFDINHSKTRLSNNLQRQEVTGLVVNDKVNINQDYYRYTRAMVNSFCTLGAFKKPKTHHHPEIETRESLIGILNHIYNIKNPKPIYANKTLIGYNNINGVNRLYLQLLFHHHFVFPTKTVLIGEGITDPRHLHLASKKINTEENTISFKSMNSFKTFKNLTNLKGGTGLLNKFLKDYYMNIFKAKVNTGTPCIILVDGDKAGSGVVKTARSNFDSFRMLTSNKQKTFLESYFVFHNLYIMQLQNGKTIEDMYSPAILSTKIGNRTLNKTNNKTKENEYGKKVFIEEVIQPNINKIDFSNFKIVFDTVNMIEHDLR